MSSEAPLKELEVINKSQGNKHAWKQIFVLAIFLEILIVETVVAEDWKSTTIHYSKTVPIAANGTASGIATFTGEEQTSTSENLIKQMLSI